MEHIQPRRALPVHDKLNEQFLYWQSAWAANYRRYASEFDDGIINWDGLLLDGWCAA